MSTAWIVLVMLPVFAAGERFSCRGRILGGYYADVKSGCRAFHVCVRVAGGGIRDFRFYCPPGTLFQQEAQTCTDWGDDDGLACPADLYDDGQFDLYKIGSGFDTKKVSSSPRREEETDFSLQRAETGDRRLQGPSSPQPQPQSDLRAAHSSDFFSGRRDQGRDEPVPTAPPTAPPVPPSTRAPYRRPPPRVTPKPTTFAPQPSPQPSSPASPVPYDPQPKRKLIRKRPIYSSPASPADYTTVKYFRSTKPDYEKFTGTQQTSAVQQKSSYTEDSGFVDVIKVSPKAIGRYDAPTDKQRYNAKSGLTEVYNYNSQSTPNYNNVNKNNNNYNAQESNNYNNQNINFNNQNRNIQGQNDDFNSQHSSYKNEKSNINNNYNNNVNYDNQNLNYNNQPSNFNNNENVNLQNNVKSGRSENRAYKATVRNNFSVAPPSDFTAQNEVRKNVEVSPNGVQRSANRNYLEHSTRNAASSTPAYRNFNSVSYDAETKFNSKQNFNSPTTPDYEKARNTAPLNLNTVAYKTNVGFDARPINYAESEEDDGQYRLPSGEDDGQYRPELYERESELLSGAHSLNIAASGNRLPEDQKPRRISSSSGQTAAPRPFSAATSTQPPRPTENFQPSVYPTTPKPRPQQPQTTTVNYYQTYSSTGRPETSAPAQTTFEYSNSVFTTTTTTTRRPVTPAHVPTTYAPVPSHKQTQAQVKPAPVQKKQSSQPSYAKPVTSKKEDTSYDYAYYDSDPGFSEYEQIEEFGKTKAKL